MPASTRKMIDCRKFPGSTCSVTIGGTEEEVLTLAIRHAVEQHGHAETSELREELRGMLFDEPAEVHA